MSLRAHFGAPSSCPIKWSSEGSSSIGLVYFYLFFIFLFLNILQFFVCLFLAAMGLHCYAWAFSNCGERGLLFVVVCGLLIAVASPVAEHGLQVHRLSSCGTQAQLLRSMWDLPRPEVKPMSPALAGGFLTTAPPGKSPGLVQLYLQSGIQDLPALGNKLDFSREGVKHLLETHAGNGHSDNDKNFREMNLNYMKCGQNFGNSTHSLNKNVNGFRRKYK